MVNQPTPTVTMSSSNFNKPTSNSNTNNKKRKRDSSQKTSQGNVPIFLRKTYELIDSCDPSIATWSPDGLSFIVKDSERFASEAIPQCFKHNNFSSFVRQLNFYGFRKVKDDHVFLKDIDHATSKWNQFFHAKFQRGKPELLAEIKKPNQVESADKQEVVQLQKQVKTLQSQVKNLQTNFQIMSSYMADLQNQVQALQQERAEPPSKRARLTASPTPEPSHHHQVPPSPEFVGSSVNALPAVGDVMEVPKPLPVTRIHSRMSSMGNVSLTEEDNAFLESLFDNDDGVFVLDDMPEEVKAAPVIKQEPIRVKREPVSQ